MMTRDALEARREELVKQRQKAEAMLLRLQGAIAAIDEILAADTADGGKKHGAE